MQLTKFLVRIPAAALVTGLSSGSAIAAETGIPECDKYFTMVEQCIAQKKMSPEDQQTSQAAVDRLRAMAPIARSPQGRAELMKRCAASLETEQKSDKYGCFAAK
ncbi:MAG TPA: hypothetical protein VK624_18950 [Steroidobacteraceae bacterium]|nr:hypothetical protein [Steroidobacteraceae bacterium]